MTSDRTFVPFESLWAMPIELPYSLLVRDGDAAWSCGQLALDENSAVIAPGDLGEQSRVVADYVRKVLERGGVDPSALKRLVLYHCADSLTKVKAMKTIFNDAFGSNLLLDAVRVPHFYYDGVMLEVDAFAGRAGQEAQHGDGVSVVEDEDFAWVTIDTPTRGIALEIEELRKAIEGYGLSFDQLVSSHWYAPSSDVSEVFNQLPPAMLADPGAIVTTPGPGSVVGSLVFDRHEQVGEWTSTDRSTQTITTTRDGRDSGWISVRSTDAALDLVDQVRSIMPMIEAALAQRQLGFEAVVKSTTYYAGDSSAEQLHDNMRVRNAYYSAPGPASTGLPVLGFADDRSHVTVDVVWRR